MGSTTPLPSSRRHQDNISGTSLHGEAHSSGVSWAAVIGGAFVTSALVLLLLALGAGLGFSSVSPWSNVGASASSVGTAAVLWLILMEIISSAMGGYLAGRLRTKWTGVHTDEVYFRDTAHGFLSWAVALVITAAFLTSATTAMVGDAAAGATSSAKTESRQLGSGDYFVDSLFRSTKQKTDPAASTSDHSEMATIFARALRNGDLGADKSYLAQQVSSTTGLSQSDAERRVSDTFVAAQQAAETTRKAIAHSLLWIFIALLIGAFCASFAATIGGRQRDHIVGIEGDATDLHRTA